MVCGKNGPDLKPAGQKGFLQDFVHVLGVKGDRKKKLIFYILSTQMALELHFYSIGISCNITTKLLPPVIIIFSFFFFLYLPNVLKFPPWGLGSTAVLFSANLLGS